MLVVALWTLFGLCVLAAFGLFVATIIGFTDAGSSYSSNSRVARNRWRSVAGLALVVAVAPFIAWGGSYIYAEGRCDALDGEFRTYSNGAGWECLLDEDFGPLPVEQNRRIDITGID